MSRATIHILTGRPPAMATRWRRQTPCLLITDRDRPAILLAISAREALVRADALPGGTAVTLYHPVAGRIAATVAGASADMLRLDLAGDAEATGYALTAIASDMTRPA